jgi:hypothetical protein
MASVAEIFGSTLQRTRRQQGLTQRQLGTLTRMSTSFIGEMERGTRRVLAERLAVRAGRVTFRASRVTRAKRAASERLFERLRLWCE